MFRALSLFLILLGLGLALWGASRLAGSGAPSQIGDPPAEALGSAASEPASAAGSRTAAPPPPAPAPAGAQGFDIASSSSSRRAATPEDRARLMRRLPLAHETPRTAQLGRSFTVTLSLDGTAAADPVAGLPGTGRVVEADAVVGSTVRADLSGPAFDIEPVSPLIQEVGEAVRNSWRWQVTPQTGGAHTLTVDLYSMDGDRALPVRSYSDTVTVEVTRFSQAVQTARTLSPVAMIIGGIGSILAGLFGAARFFRGH